MKTKVSQCQKQALTNNKEDDRVIRVGNGQALEDRGQKEERADKEEGRFDITEEVSPPIALLVDHKKDRETRGARNEHSEENLFVIAILVEKLEAYLYFPHMDETESYRNLLPERGLVY